VGGTALLWVSAVWLSPGPVERLLLVEVTVGGLTRHVLLESAQLFRRIGHKHRMCAHCYVGVSEQQCPHMLAVPCLIAVDGLGYDAKAELPQPIHMPLRRMLGHHAHSTWCYWRHCNGWWGVLGCHSIDTNQAANLGGGGLQPRVYKPCAVNLLCVGGCDHSYAHVGSSWRLMPAVGRQWEPPGALACWQV
jgi:hypothetical protein